MLQINEIGLWRMIDERIRYMNLNINEVDIQSWYVDVNSFYQEEQLGQDTAVLINPELDIPYTAQLILDAGNNKLVTSKEDYEKLVYAGFQFFQDQLNITVSNYGTDFVPFRLEFLKIIPKLKR